MEPVFADAAIDHLGSRDVLQTTAVNAHNIMTLYWHAGCLLSVMRKHLNRWCWGNHHYCINSCTCKHTNCCLRESLKVVLMLSYTITFPVMELDVTQCAPILWHWMVWFCSWGTLNLVQCVMVAIQFRPPTPTRVGWFLTL